MANTLCDHGINPYEPVRVVVKLIAAGFLARDIEQNWDAVVMMAAIRMANEERR